VLKRIFKLSEIISKVKVIPGCEGVRDNLLDLIIISYNYYFVISVRCFLFIVFTKYRNAFSENTTSITRIRFYLKLYPVHMYS